MGTETEVKIEIDEPESFVRLLQARNYRVVSDRHFEDNLLLDFPGATLKSSGRLFRIRFANEKAILTYKGPPKADGIFKTREELEIGLDSGIGAVEILERIGMRVWFRYQKYRREFALHGVLIAVDETPIGNYVELEGTETGICDLARTLDLDASRFLRHSYYALYVHFCRIRGNPPGNMVF